MEPPAAASPPEAEPALPLPPPADRAAPASAGSRREAFFGPPQPGQLIPLWAVLTALLWSVVFLALTGVWKASQELGLNTWWLGPFSDPNPLYVRLLPFYAPTVMVIASLSNVRRLPWIGLSASVITVAIGLADLGEVRRLGIVEIAVGVAAAVFSIASRAATYRPPAT